MFAILAQRRLRWLGHVCRMEDGRIPKDILYGELTTGKHPTGRPALRHIDVWKKDLKSRGFNPGELEAETSDRTSLAIKDKIRDGVKLAEERRESQGEEQRICKRQTSVLLCRSLHPDHWLHLQQVPSQLRISHGTTQPQTTTTSSQSKPAANQNRESILVFFDVFLQLS